jgi:hypothetical protein
MYERSLMVGKNMSKFTDRNTKEIYDPYKKDEKEGENSIRGQKGGRR